MAQIISTGYLLKNQNEWFEEERGLYLDIDPEWNLDASTPDGLKLAHDSEVFANLDELAQRAYNSKDPTKAKELDLQILCALTGTERDNGSPSTVAVMLGGVPGTFIGAGKVIQSDVDGSQWKLTTAATLDGAGEAAATAQCLVNGATEASVGTITQIIDTVGGWQTVTNTSIATLGRDVQTDASLRVERELTVGKAGTNQVEQLYASVYGVPEVRRVKVYENEEDAVDGNGQPGHSTAVIVDGGADADIARAIYDVRSTGVKQYQPGTPVTVSVESLKYPGLTQTIKFARPTYVDITVVVTIVNDGSLPTDVEDRVKAAIIEYSIGQLIDPECGFNTLGFGIADIVSLSRMYTPINSVIGSYGSSYVSALTLNGSVANVAIAFDEMARFATSNITVNIT